ncbi:MAG: hypothetical protein D6752_06610 [Candidatus Nitrosothermus koennekii]|nr:MAG: hypothetical protein D6752_06610 [Candidatus Nitrosothermus koennekii]
MFGFGKTSFKEGDYIFGTIYEGDYCSIIIGVVEFKHDNRLKIKGTHIKPIGLLEKVKSGKLPPRFNEVLKAPNPNNVIHILLNKVDTNDFEDYIDLTQFNSVEKINVKRFSEMDYWVKEGFPELFAMVLSQDPRRDEARKMLIDKMNSIPDAEIKRTIYAIARQLKII